MEHCTLDNTEGYSQIELDEINERIDQEIDACLVPGETREQWIEVSDYEYQALCERVITEYDTDNSGGEGIGWE